jgi:hypothetical protein
MTISLPDWQGMFEPAAVHMLGEVFDEVWARIAPEIDKSRDDVKFARNQLALIVVRLAKDGQLSPLQITRTATRLMRQAYEMRRTHPLGGAWRPKTDSELYRLGVRRGAKMSRLSTRLARTDQGIRNLTRRIDLYRSRVVRKSKNPALAEQATQLLLAAQTTLAELLQYRKRLLHALEMEDFLSPQESRLPPRSPLVPRYLR